MRGHRGLVGGQLGPTAGQLVGLRPRSLLELLDRCASHPRPHEPVERILLGTASIGQGTVLVDTHALAGELRPSLELAPMAIAADRGDGSAPRAPSRPRGRDGRLRRLPGLHQTRVLALDLGSLGHRPLDGDLGGGFGGATQVEEALQIRWHGEGGVALDGKAA